MVTNDMSTHDMATIVNPMGSEEKEFKKIDRDNNRDNNRDNAQEVDADIDEDTDDNESGVTLRAREEADAALELEKLAQAGGFNFEDESEFDFDAIDNILNLNETTFPKFTLAKNKARFLRMVSWYRQKEEWIEVAPVSGVTKLFKQQSKELEGIRASKMDYEMELETGTLTPSQRSYRRDELKMCRVQEKMAVHLISKLQVKIKSGRR